MEIMGTPKNSINANTLWGDFRNSNSTAESDLGHMLTTLINSITGMANVVEEIQE